jgi:hypothetical protein
MRRSDKAAAFLFASAIFIALMGLSLVTDSGPMDANKSIPMVAVSIFVAACLCTAAVLWARGGRDG